MPYRFQTNESVRAGAGRIATEQIDRAVGDVEDPSLDAAETVHAVRKRCKKIRAVLRLLRDELDNDGTYSEENAWYRDSARALADLRDAVAMIECYDRLADSYSSQIDRRALGRIRRAFTLRRKALSEHDSDLHRRLEAFRGKMIAGRERLSDWPVESTGFAALRGGLIKTYKRARKGLKTAYDEGTDEAFHEWRKRIKYHWYHMRLLRNVWPGLMKQRARLVHDLASLLGDDHDLAVMRQTVVRSPDEFGDKKTRQLLFGLIDRRMAELQAAARPLGEHVLAEKPKALARRLESHWRTWQSEAVGG